MTDYEKSRFTKINKRLENENNFLISIMPSKPKNPKNKAVAIFEGRKVRRIWDEKKECWYFSVVDVVRILTESVGAGAYWRKLKQRLNEENSEVVTKCHDLKFIADDSKYYSSSAADIETIFRIIQSIPSPKAEPFKLWLAKVG